MNPRHRIGAWLVPIVAMIGIGFAIYEANQARVVAAAANDAIRGRDELRRQIQQAAARLIRAEKERADREMVATKIDAANSTAGAAVVDLQANATKSSGWASPGPWVLTARDPKLRALHLKSFEEDLDAKWGPLFKQLKLPPDKIEQFRMSRLAWETERQNIYAMDLTEAERQKLLSANGAQSGKQLKALFSPEEFTAYQQYNHAVGMPASPVQPLVESVAKMVYSSETPLTLEQGLQLTRILAGTLEKDRTGFVHASAATDLDAAIAQAMQAGFPPAQIAALRTRQEELQTSRQISQTIDSLLQRYPSLDRASLAGAVQFGFP